jgi:hypothetical protein
MTAELTGAQPMYGQQTSQTQQSPESQRGQIHVIRSRFVLFFNPERSATKHTQTNADHVRLKRDQTASDIPENNVTTGNETSAETQLKLPNTYYIQNIVAHTSRKN